MPTLILNGARLQIRLMEVEVRKLRLDPENPRLHSSYLTHELPAAPTQAQLAQALEQLPEFQALKDALARNEGCFQPPLVTLDLRVLEGNRRVAAVRRLRAEQTKSRRWETITVHQLVKRVTDSQEKALRAKFHLEGMLPWDGLSQLTEYVAVAEREGPDFVAMMLGRFRPQIEPLLVAGRAVRLFAQTYPEARQAELLWVLVGLCGVKQIEPQVAFSRSTRCIFTDHDDERPANQPFALAKIMSWLVEGRLTKAYQDGERQLEIRPGQVPVLFRRVRLAGNEEMSYFLEPEGSLAKAVSFMESGQSTVHWQQQRALTGTRKYMDLLNGLKTIRREESPDLYRDTLSCYHRLEQLLGIRRRELRKESRYVRAS
jgi:hypothetical protein